MERVYILNNVLIPSSANISSGVNASEYVRGPGFNSSNCKSTVTYYVTVDDNLYGSFTLDDNTVGFILDGLMYGSEYETSAQLPRIGNLSLNMFDWNADGDDPGWQWIGSSDAVVSIYYDADVKYFENTELNNLWNKLVTRTEELCAEEIGKGEWNITCLVGDYPGTVASIYDQEFLFFSGDPGFLLDETTGQMIDVFYAEDYFEENPWDKPTGDFLATELVPLSSLNTSHTYYVLNGHSEDKEYKVVYVKNSKLTTGSAEEIHDALIKHFGLTHNNAPSTVGDYMKGISVAANYYTNDNQMDLSSINSLGQIVDRLSHSCQLSEDMVLTLNGHSSETGFRLYDAETGEELAQTGAMSNDVFDLKDYYSNFQYKKQYYAIAEWMVYDYSNEDYTDYVFYYIRSNPARYGVKEDEEDYIFTLSDQLYLTSNRSITNLYSDISLKLYRDNELIGKIMGADANVPYNFLDGSWDDEAPVFTSGEYYATIAWENTYGEYFSYETNPVNYVSPGDDYSYEIYFSGTNVYLKPWAPDGSGNETRLYLRSNNLSFPDGVLSFVSSGDVDTFICNISDYWGDPVNGDTFSVWLSPSDSSYEIISNTITYYYSTEPPIDEDIQINYIAMGQQANTYSLYAVMTDVVSVDKWMVEILDADGTVLSDTFEYSGGYELEILDITEIYSDFVSNATYQVSVTAQKGESSSTHTQSFTWPFGEPGSSFLGSISALQDMTEIVVTAENFTIGDIEISISTTWNDTYYHNDTVNGPTYTFDPAAHWSTALQDMYKNDKLTEHTLTIKAYDQSDNSNYATTTVNYTYYPNEEPDEENYPDISATPYAEWRDNNIYISGYSDEKYNGTEVRVTTRYWDTQPEPEYYTTYGNLQNGYVMDGNGNMFEGYPYDSTYEYTIQLYQYIEEEGREEYSPEFTMEHL